MPRGHPYAQSKLIKSLASWSGQHHTNRNNNIRMLSGRISGGITGGNGYVVPSLPPSSTRLAIPKRSLAQTIVSNAINSALNTIFRKQINPQPGKSKGVAAGKSVAVSGSTIVVGAPKDNDAGPEAGAVFISINDGTSFTKIVNPAPGTGIDQQFGSSVAISGSTIVVGAPRDNDAGPAGAGAVFISINDGTSFTKIVNPTPGTGIYQLFGSSVAVSGSTIVVGAPNDDDAGPDAGAVFISTNDGTSFTKIVNPTPGTGTYQLFGSSVAISGSTIVVGAPGDTNDVGNQVGSVFISINDGTSFTKIVNPAPGTGIDQLFGSSVAISGSTIVVGAPKDNDAGPEAGAVFISTNDGTSFTKIVNPTPGTGIYQQFGYSVAISGSTIVVGAPRDSDAGPTSAGAVFISINSGGSWTKIVNPTPGTGIDQQFGSSVAISGSTIVVGAPGDNDAGPAGAGAVFISINDGTSFTKIVNPAPGTGSGQQFGSSVAISGSTIVVGAPRDNDAGPAGAGAVFISINSGGSWGTKIVNPTPGTGIYQQFGYSVAISGSTIVVGAPGDSDAGPTDAGAVFISINSGVSFTKIVNPNPGTGIDQKFGLSVAISGSTIVVGAPNDDDAGPTDAGAVFISINSGGSWTKIVNPTPGTGIDQQFGDSVAISGSTIVVGAPVDRNDVGNQVGSVFINN